MHYHTPLLHTKKKKNCAQITYKFCSYLDVKLIDLLEEVLNALLTLAIMQEEEAGAAPRQKCIHGLSVKTVNDL